MKKLNEEIKIVLKKQSMYWIDNVYEVNSQFNEIDCFSRFVKLFPTIIKLYPTI